MIGKGKHHNTKNYRQTDVYADNRILKAHVYA